MKTIIIRRVVTGAHGTFGVLIHDSIPFALSLEREWLDNQRSISCIPAGTYICERVNSPRHGDTFEITEVPGRSHILFHKGNIDDDSHGCVIVGEQFGVLRGSPAVLASSDGYKELHNILRDEDVFRCIIVDDWKNPIN